MEKIINNSLFAILIGLVVMMFVLLYAPAYAQEIPQETEAMYAFSQNLENQARELGVYEQVESLFAQINQLFEQLFELENEQ